MGSPTYRIRGLILKRTKLGESDVICTILAENGSQIRAVAKGARKPSSSLSSRVELFSLCDLLVVKGKSLDIIKEARFVEGNAALRLDLRLTEAASPMVELLERVTLDSLDNPKLYSLTTKALSTLCSKRNNPSAFLTICAAQLLKAVSISGFKPELQACIGCGATDELPHAQQLGRCVAFSYIEGGLLCSQCSSLYETQWLDPAILQWVHILMYSTFEQIESYTLSPDIQIELLHFIQTWVKTHIGYTLKSLTYIFSYGMQE